MEPDNPFSIFVGCCSMAVYACIIVMLKQFSSKYNVFVIGVCYMPLQALAMLAGLWVMNSFVATQSLSFPSGSEWWLVLLLATLYTMGSSLNYTAYSLNASVPMMSCLSLLLPVFASLIAYVIYRTTPNIWQLAAYGTGAVTVLLLVKGSVAQKVAAKLALAAAQ